MIQVSNTVDAPSCSSCGERTAVTSLSIGRIDGITFTVRLCRNCVVDLAYAVAPVAEALQGEGG